MRIFSFIILLLICLPALAVDRITATITITNAPTTNGMTITVNSDVRTWTNNVATPASQILTNNSIGGIATNYWQQINATPYGGGLIPAFPATNQITLAGIVGGSMSVSFSGNYASVTYSTQTVSALMTVRVPLSSENVNVRTNIASLLAQGLGDYATNGPTNLLLVTARILNPTITNGVNYGNAFSSPSASLNAEQFGVGALANSINSVALGNSANVTVVATNGTALGAFSTASRNSATAVGAGATASGFQSIGVGVSTVAAATNAIAIGTSSQAGQVSAVAIGTSVNTTRTNQVMLGDSTYQVNIPGYLTGGSISNMTYSGNIGILTNGTLTGQTITNATYYGTVASLTGGLLTSGGLTNYSVTNITTYSTNVYGGIRRYPRSNNTSLANGNNAGIDFGTVSYVKIKAGPTGAFTLNGIAGGADGRLLIIVNRTGQNVTVANDSGVDPTPANRIYTLTGADVTSTGDAAITLIYDSEDSRWNLVSIQQ